MLPWLMLAAGLLFIVASQVKAKVERTECGANSQSGVQDPMQELNWITHLLSVHAAMPMNSLNVGRSDEMEDMGRLDEDE